MKVIAGDNHVIKLMGFATGTDFIIYYMSLSKSTYVETRKTVSYTHIGRSQKKFWWKPEQVLTCKSFSKCGYSGERLIELSSSWFRPKFPLG